MSKNKIISINNDDILKNNPKIDLQLIEESDKLRNSAFGRAKTPEYTLLPALGGTKEQRLNNKIYYLG